MFLRTVTEKIVTSSSALSLSFAFDLDYSRLSARVRITDNGGDGVRALCSDPLDGIPTSIVAEVPVGGCRVRFWRLSRSRPVVLGISANGTFRKCRLLR